MKTLRILLAVILAGAISAGAQSKPAAHPELLVSTEWLAAHLSDPNLVLVHVAGNPSDYHAAHIPGARFLATDKIAGPGTELLPPEQIKANLEAIGISDNSRVVMYAPDWDPIAARLFFTLAYIGHADHAALLDGGMDMWTQEKRTLSTEEPKITPGRLTLHLHPEVLVKLEEVKKMVSEASSNAAVVDSRPGRRYRQGHLPGAGSFFWENALVSGDRPVLRRPEELRKLFASAGFAPGKQVVSYCEVGLQASYTFFLARYLGLDAAMYDGSYSEWNSSHQDVVRGPSAR